VSLNPLTQRRLKVFVNYRPGYYSSFILAAVVVLTLFAEILCNQRPLLARINGQIYVPIFKTYAETEFGGFFETEMDYTDSLFLDLLANPGNWAVFPPIRFDYQFVDTTLKVPAPSPPDGKHFLGTDDRARDVMARLIYGFRLSFLFGLTLALVGSFVGVILGALQGFWGGMFDLFCQRLIEIWSSQNELYLLIILSSIFSPSIFLIFVLISLFGWMGLAAYVRAEYLRARQMEYVAAALALGGRPLRVMLRHILPNTLVPVVTFFPFRVSSGIMGLTALDFLGLGVPSPTASLGELLNQGKAHMSHGTWWIIVSVFIVIVTTIMMLNFIGEGIQKAFDPKSSLT
jgi:microcin C transport system permease protein